MISTKKLLIAAGIALAGVALVGYRKVSALQLAWDKMDITPYWIDSPTIGLTSSSFKVDVQLANRSSEAFDISAGELARLRRIEFIEAGQTIAVANVDLGEISIPAFGSQIIRNIPVTVSTAVLVSHLDDISNPSQLTAFMASLQLVGYVEFLGSEYQIGT